MYAHYRLTVITRTRYVPGPEYDIGRVAIAIEDDYKHCFEGITKLEYDRESIELSPTTRYHFDNDDIIYIPSAEWTDTLRQLKDIRDVYNHLRLLYSRIVGAEGPKYMFIEDEDHSSDEN